MKAQEFKRIAEEKNSSRDDKQYKEIMHLIEIAARKGLFSIQWKSFLKDNVKNLLGADGFKVLDKSYFDPRDGGETIYIISWS